MGNKVLSSALVALGLFLLMTTKGVVLGLPIAFIAVVLVVVGAYRLFRAFR